MQFAYTEQNLIKCWSVASLPVEGDRLVRPVATVRHSLAVASYRELASHQYALTEVARNVAR